jgi:putative transposase
MKKSRYSEQQIIKILKAGEAGQKVNDLCRQYGISKSSYYKWKARYGGLEASELSRLKVLEAENRQLKQMYAELSLEHKVLQDIVQKKD